MISLPNVRVKSPGMFEISRNHVSIHGYKTTDPWEAILAPNYFLPIWTWFTSQEGKARPWNPDTIKVYRKVQAGTAHYWEVADLIVTYADEKRMTVAQLSPVLVVGNPAAESNLYPEAPEQPDRMAKAREALAAKRAEKAAA